jgi:DNA-binding response OmpR family regulator
LVKRSEKAQPLVLIVEDEEGLREILELNFHSAGYRVIVAADGRTAWQEFEREGPDLLLLDLNLPQISGFRLLELVRSESSVPVLILTAYDFAEAEEVVRNRPDAFVKKPFDVQDVIRVADHLVNRGSDP